MSERLDPLLVHADGSAVFHRERDRGYPLIERGEGMWLVDAGGNRYLDAVGGGAMVASLGAGEADVVAAAAAQLAGSASSTTSGSRARPRSGWPASWWGSRPGSPASTSRAAAPRRTRRCCGSRARRPALSARLHPRPPAHAPVQPDRRARTLAAIRDAIAEHGAQQLPLRPDIVSTAKGLGAGYAPVAAVLCRERVYEAVAGGSRSFELGHTWDGAPLSCAVGLAVIEHLRRERLVERVAARGPEVRAPLAEALAGSPMVAEVRGQGFLFGIEYAPRIDQEALRRGSSSIRRSPRRTATRATRH